MPETTTEETTMEFEKMMGTLLAGVLATQALSSARNDETLARQAVKDNQRESHLNTLSAIQSAYEVTMPEAFAVAKLAQSYTAGDAMATNLASVTPPMATFKIVPAA